MVGLGVGGRDETQKALGIGGDPGQRVSHASIEKALDSTQFLLPFATIRSAGKAGANGDDRRLGIGETWNTTRRGDAVLDHPAAIAACRHGDGGCKMAACVGLAVATRMRLGSDWRAPLGRMGAVATPMRAEARTMMAFKSFPRRPIRQGC